MLLQLWEGPTPARTPFISIAKLMMLMLMTAKVISEAQVSAGLVNGINGASMGTAAAVSYKEERLKRSVPAPSLDDTLFGEEAMLPLPLYHRHLHRDKRTPCYYGGGGGGPGGGGASGNGAGGGGAGGGIPGGGGIDSAAIDEIARRLQANARQRLAAAKQKAQTRKKATDSRKKKFTNDDNPIDEPLSRRKRQSEVDDLNENMANNGNKDFSQHVQKVADKIQALWQEFAQSMNNMAQRIKQHFGDKNSPNASEV